MIYILILSDKRKQGGGVGLNYSRRPASQSARIHGRQAMYRSAPLVSKGLFAGATFRKIRSYRFKVS